MRAVIEEDRYRPGFLNLVVDGTPQSQVNPDDPRELGFEYVQRIGHVIDLLGEPGAPITAVHLGAGALTLPRYVTETRPGSRQQVLELEPALVELVREHIPLPQNSGIRVRYGDAREGLGKLPAALTGTVDLVVVDIFSGSRIPAHVTTVEFYRQVAALLAPEGVIAVNLADGPGLAFARGQAATLGAAVTEVAALAETSILKGRRFGNIVLVGSNAPLPLEWLPRLLAAGPHPSKAVAGRELRDFVAGAPVVTDESAKPSPPPARMFLAVDRDGER
ncbi:spermidine synthase [Naasia aerilata]|nr:fused MFS/spermidine synthase [Naasia aerilata]